MNHNDKEYGLASDNDKEHGLTSDNQQEPQMMEHNDTEYQVLLYYKYVPIADADSFASAHRALCNEIGLKGRIIIAREGINGTVSGTIQQTTAYMDAMHADSRFADMPFKVDPYHEHAFGKLKIKVKPELVNLSLAENVDPNQLTGKRLTPKQFLEHLEQDDVVVLDGRNNYEYDLGHFRNAIRPDVKTFREFPEWIRENRELFEHKKILTYCTGGIRCEKLSGLLLREGFEDVSQLDGGIVTYGKDSAARGQYFDGKCYVFDERIGVSVNQVEDVIVGRCYHCDAAAETYINCAYPSCHRQHIVCEDCDARFAGYCSQACHDAHALKEGTAHLHHA